MSDSNKKSVPTILLALGVMLCLTPVLLVFFLLSMFFGVMLFVVDVLPSIWERVLEGVE